jgi:hypothetical protein
MYYRVAMQRHPASAWRWQSTILSSLRALVQFLRPYGALTQDRLRVFCARSREEMDELLARENDGTGSGSVMAAQFLHERGLDFYHRNETSAASGRLERQRGTVVVRTAPRLEESTQAEPAIMMQAWSANALERRRYELEQGPGGDHDVPYSFALPASMPQVLSWMRLLARVQRGELQP